jgi:hypothetical protein
VYSMLVVLGSRAITSTKLDGKLERRLEYGGRTVSNWTGQRKWSNLISAPDAPRTSGFVFRACYVVGKGSIFEIDQESGNQMFGLRPTLN